MEGGGGWHDGLGVAEFFSNLTLVTPLYYIILH